jgi:hypothetical protein
MLAYLTTTFQIGGQRATYPYLASKFRECCCGIEVSSPLIGNLKLWFLMVGAITAFDSSEPWLQQSWTSDVPNLSWHEARYRLNEVMWIGNLHEMPAKLAFDKLNSYRTDSERSSTSPSEQPPTVT